MSDAVHIESIETDLSRHATMVSRAAASRTLQRNKGRNTEKQSDTISLRPNMRRTLVRIPLTFGWTNADNIARTSNHSLRRFTRGTTHR